MLESIVSYIIEHKLKKFPDIIPDIDIDPDEWPQADVCDEYNIENDNGKTKCDLTT